MLRVRATHVGPDLSARNVLVNVRKAVEQNAQQGAGQAVGQAAEMGAVQNSAENPSGSSELVGVGAGGQEEEVEPAF